MANLEIKGKNGKKVGGHEVAAAIMNARPSSTTVHRTIVAEEANARQGTQSAKTRAEVRGGGKKPYKQKKTGNARQGTTRAPHYAHGSMALAVKPRGYERKVNKKERRATILAAIGEKVENESLILMDAISFAAPKTKDAIELLKALGLENERRVLIVIPAIDEPTYKSFRNLPNVTVKTAPSKEEGAKTDVFSARDVMVARKMVVAKDAMAKIEEVWA